MPLTDPKPTPADEPSSDEPTNDLTIPAFLKRQDNAPEPEKAEAQEDEMSKKNASAAKADGATKPKKARAAAGKSERRTPTAKKDARKTAPRPVRAAAKPRKAKAEPKQPKTGKPKKTPKEANVARIDTKSARLEAMLRSAKGTTIAEVVEAFGWLPHTARAAISAGIGKKRGLTIVTEKDEKRGRVYRIAA